MEPEDDESSINTDKFSFQNLLELKELFDTADKDKGSTLSIDEACFITSSWKQCNRYSKSISLLNNSSNYS